MPIQYIWVMKMSINEILTENGMTKYRLAKLSGVPHATLNDICSGKTRIEKCSGETLYKLAKVLSRCGKQSFCVIVKFLCRWKPYWNRQ